MLLFVHALNVMDAIKRARNALADVFFDWINNNCTNVIKN